MAFPADDIYPAGSLVKIVERETCDLVVNVTAEACLARPYLKSMAGYNKMASTCDIKKLACSYILDIGIV